MTRTNRVYFWLAAAVLLAGVSIAAWMYLRNGEKPTKRPPNTIKAPAAKNKASSQKTAKGLKEAKPNAAPVTNTIVIIDDDVDEDGVRLTEEMRRILAEIQECLDNEDRKSLSKVCEKIAKIQRERGEGAVPASVRAKAVEAVGQFLPASLAELIGFMADSDPDVVDEVFNQLDTLLNDTTIGDRELSTMLVAVSKVLTNEDAIDSLAMAVDMNMRNSVKVATCQQILDSGSEAVVARIRETIADMLEVEEEELPQDSEALKQKLAGWLVENPDDEDDEEFYKGVE